LYQAIPGTRLGRIVRAERGVDGLGNASDGAHTELHPLTQEAAGLLLGHPELGRDVSETYLDETGPVSVGQRFYYLEIPGGRPAAAGGTRRPRLSEASAAIDVRSSQLVLALYLSEAQAQAIASLLRRKVPVVTVMTTLRPLLGSLASLASPAGLRRVRIVGRARETELGEEQFLKIPGRSLSPDRIGKLLVRWARTTIASEIVSRGKQFVSAASAPADGITLRVTLDRAPGLALLADLLRGRIGFKALTGLAGLLKARPPEGRLEIEPGHHRA
jgi:hypothetical protein